MKKAIFLSALLLCSNIVSAFALAPSWEFGARAGLAVGGAAPLPMPEEIRSIESFNPGLNPFLAGNACLRWSKLGISSGLRLERKGMVADATTKSYGTEIVQGDSRISGYWTGKVSMNYSSWNLTVPICADWKFSDKVSAHLGAYCSWALAGTFDGYVTDGYLREGSPTGTKVLFTAQERGDYDFSADLRPFHVGILAGAEYYFSSHIGLSADLSFEPGDIFKADFTTIDFALKRIYFALGLTYRF